MYLKKYLKYKIKYQNLKGGGINLNIEFTNDTMTITQQDSGDEQESVDKQESKEDLMVLRSSLDEKPRYDSDNINMYESMSLETKFEIWVGESQENIRATILTHNVISSSEALKQIINIGKTKIIDVLLNAIPINFLIALFDPPEPNYDYQKLIHCAKQYIWNFEKFKLKDLFTIQEIESNTIKIKPLWDKLAKILKKIKKEMCDVIINRLNRGQNNGDGLSNFINNYDYTQTSKFVFTALYTAPLYHSYVNIPRYSLDTNSNHIRDR